MTRQNAACGVWIRRVVHGLAHPIPTRGLARKSNKRKVFRSLASGFHGRAATISGKAHSRPALLKAMDAEFKSILAHVVDHPRVDEIPQGHEFDEDHSWAGSSTSPRTTTFLNRAPTRHRPGRTRVGHGAGSLYTGSPVGVRAQERARSDALRAGPAVGVLGLVVSVFAALSVARTGSLSGVSLIAPLGLAGAMILLSLRPETLFLSWLALAPLFQASADSSPIGRAGSLAFYVAPPLVLGFWTFTRLTLVPALRVVDTLPAAFFLYVTGSLLLSTDDASTSMKSLYTSIGIGVILYYFFAFGPIGSLSWEKIAAVLLMVCTLEALMGIVDSLTGWNLWNDNTGWREGVPRAVATLVNPGILGAFVGMGVVFALSLLVWGGPERLRTVAIVTIILGVPAVFLTYTRAPIVATILAGVAVLASRPNTRLIACGSLVVAAVVLIASWGRISQSALYQARVTNKSNIQARVLIQDWSLELAAERPLFGWGAGSFDRVKNSADLSSGEVPRAWGIDNTSHNTYLTILVESGAAGLALLLMPWLVIIVKSLKLATARPELRWFVVGSFAAIAVYVLVANTLDMRFFSFVPALPWLFLGLLRRGRSFGGAGAFVSR